MRVHIVQKGDTLWKIAKQYAIGFDELKRLNAHLANPDYIVPGMEIYLPAMQKEKEIMKEKPVQQVAPAPAPKEQMKEQPMWQGDIYFQPQMPMQPVQMPMPQMPMPIPQWQQTHVHVEPTIEQTMLMPPMPMPQPMQMQPISMPPMPQMMPMPMYMHPPMPQMMPHPMPICMCCHGVRMDEQTMTAPLQREESSVMPKKCPDHDARVQQYYEDIQQMAQQPCCPTPTPHPYAMPMHPMMRQWHI